MTTCAAASRLSIAPSTRRPQSSPAIAQAQAFAIAAPLASAAIAALSSAAVAVVAGQQDDLDIPNSNSDRAALSHNDQEALLLRIHRRKTGLLAASMQLGACVADATPAAGTLDRLAQAGVHRGVAFQYIDDLLDVTAGAELEKHPVRTQNSTSSPP